MSTTITTTDQPAPWREVWLTVALHVARGMPAPTWLVCDQDGTELRMRFATVAQMEAWTPLLANRQTWTRFTDDEGRRYAYGACLMGWQVSLSALEAIPETEPHPELAAQLAAAILTPDAEPVSA